ncbi:hypothetical protein I302_100408 [Kwoniella bestiolae CBS 10118]|uniref:Uncharacterized protein n=1 Tax=Kwoniella bestiolae CBS 10118 TaxID=1296100 RepID=A0A1B9G512_9TREE|nr:hypothetical protein I302_03783 [Kwoniella bestiolae CBS 10118]OCF26106.1 hypothetical protein I302_03783 [Kwoniella bestiolae CBS 10118]
MDIFHTYIQPRRTYESELYRMDEELLIHIRKLTINHHPSHYCRSTRFENFVLPNLKTVDLRSPLFSSLSDRFHSDPPKWRGSESRSRCKLLAKLRPKTVIIRDMNCDDLDFMPPDTCRTMWENVENVIFTLPSIYARKNTDLRSCGLAVYPNFKKIYWMYDPTSTVEYPDRYPYDLELEDDKDLNDWAITEVTLSHPHCDIIIVNVESTRTKEDSGPSSSEQFQKDEEEIFRADIAYRCRADADLPESDIKGEEAIKKRLDTIRFITLDEFIEKEDWFDWFDPKELESWNKAMDGKVGTLQ